MKRAAIFFLFMTFIILLLPMLIVKSCSNGEVKGPTAKKEIKHSTKIKVYIHTEKKVVEMPLEEYLKGVVAAEMPAQFELEALMAQAIAARTYAYGRMVKLYTPKDDTHGSADICTDSTHCQAWVAKDPVMKKWGVFSASKNWSKISNAVDSTRNIILVYGDSVVNPVFHSNSGGKTENSEDVWEGGQVPYLRSVESEGEDNNPEYENSVIITIQEFCSRLKGEYPELKLNEQDVLKNIKVLGNTEGGRVKNIKVGNIAIKGTDFRRVFSLKSANFKLSKENKNSIRVTTYGNGHGVGMSQWGANSMAKNGGNHEEILKYYYRGVELVAIDDITPGKK